MIRNLVARFMLVALAAAACSRSDSPPASDEAARATQDARARAEDLANSTQIYQPVRFVSEIEQIRPPRPVTRRKQEEVVRKGVDSIVVEPTAIPTFVPEPDTPDPPVDSTVTVVSSPRVPSVIPREAPLPEAVGGSGLGEWRGNDPGPDMGTVIGVVLRGGRGDPGHCPRHPRPPSQIPNRIPR
jgi:hypothetical protein